MSLATKYRPSNFDEVIGQELIVKILKGQLADANIKQGYLFTGGAGTGKTTVARILANSLNLNKKGIIEIDAASNNGVDNIRNLIENAKSKPIDAKYKVYIIDEAHMLSTGAFNALLKILEEPPEYVVFILATTDPQKIIPTILSRLQRFDFKKVDTKTLVSRLQVIAKAEKLKIKEDTLAYIAKLSGGGVRDAISMLDTVISYKGNNIELQDAQFALNRTNYTTQVNLYAHIQRKNAGVAIDIIRTLNADGVNMKAFLKEFTETVVEINQIIVFNLDVPDYLDKSLINEVEASISLFNDLLNLTALIKNESSYMYLIEGWLMHICNQ